MPSAPHVRRRSTSPAGNQGRANYHHHAEEENRLREGTWPARVLWNLSWARTSFLLGHFSIIYFNKDINPFRHHTCSVVQGALWGHSWSRILDLPLTAWPWVNGLFPPRSSFPDFCWRVCSVSYRGRRVQTSNYNHQFVFSSPFVYVNFCFFYWKLLLSTYRFGTVMFSWGTESFIIISCTS